jgi:hypothetical protein
MKVFQKLKIDPVHHQAIPFLSNEEVWIILPDFKIYYKSVVTKTQLCCPEYKDIDQWNRIGSWEVNTHIYNQLIFSKGAKNKHWGKDGLFNKWCWGEWIQR